jgi:hypothetical protein
MEHELVMVGTAPAMAHGLRLRISAVLVGIAMTFAMLVVVQHRADAAPVASAAVAAVALPAVGAATAQIDIGQFICSILIAVRNAFASVPFFSFVAQALNPILVAFGCAPSGT